MKGKNMRSNTRSKLVLLLCLAVFAAVFAITVTSLRADPFPDCIESWGPFPPCLKQCGYLFKNCPTNCICGFSDCRVVCNSGSNIRQQRCVQLGSGPCKYWAVCGNGYFCNGTFC